MVTAPAPHIWYSSKINMYQQTDFGMVKWSNTKPAESSCLLIRTPFLWLRNRLFCRIRLWQGTRMLEAGTGAKKTVQVYQHLSMQFDWHLRRKYDFNLSVDPLPMMLMSCEQKNTRPTSCCEACAKRVVLGLAVGFGILPVSSTFPSNKSLMMFLYLVSNRIPKLNHKTYQHKNWRNHLCCNLISNTGMYCS